MLLDHTHKRWMWFTLAASVAAAGVYLLFTVGEEEVRGGSALGLTYGILGTGLMVFAALLSARKKLLAWRLGRAQTWMRGHLWLGLLSVPLILFHAGFRFGGPLSTLVLVLLLVVIVSGLAGAALQHFLPRLMTLQVPMETIYDEIDNVRAQLLGDADQLIAAVCGPLPGAAAAEAPKPTARPAASAGVEIDDSSREHLRELYLGKLRPFLEQPERREALLATGSQAEQVFARWRVLLPPALHETLAHLEDICEEERQLTRQAQLHHWLHGWLLVHLPLSWALLVLTAVHAVVALRY